MGISTFTEKVIVENADGSVSEKIVERTHTIERNSEPDYIKIYTRMWCEFNGIPDVWREFFLQLASRMTYADASDSNGGQIVFTGDPTRSYIEKTLKWKDSMYFKGLEALCSCGAIRKLKKRGVYQINPSYAGRGEWKYNPRLQRGGIEDIVAKFSFRDREVDTRIVWADDGQDNEFNEMYRAATGAQPGEQVIVKKTHISEPSKSEET